MSPTAPSPLRWAEGVGRVPALPGPTLHRLCPQPACAPHLPHQMSFLFQPSAVVLPPCRAGSPPTPSTPVHFLQADFILASGAGMWGGGRHSPAWSSGVRSLLWPSSYTFLCPHPYPRALPDTHHPTLSAAGLCSCASSDEGSFPGGPCVGL